MKMVIPMWLQRPRRVKFQKAQGTRRRFSTQLVFVIGQVPLKFDLIRRVKNTLSALVQYYVQMVCSNMISVQKVTKTSQKICFKNILENVTIFLRTSKFFTFLKM